MTTDNPRFLYAVLCDDVRREVGNKMSLIGVYDNALIIERFPAVVPRLCIVIHAKSPSSQPFERFKVVIKCDDEVLIEAEVPASQLASAAAVESSQAPDGSIIEPADRAIVVHIVLVLSPIAFEKPCKMRVRAITESEELRGGTFYVTSADARTEAIPAVSPVA